MKEYPGWKSLSLFSKFCYRIIEWTWICLSEACLPPFSFFCHKDVFIDLLTWMTPLPFLPFNRSESLSFGCCTFLISGMRSLWISFTDAKKKIQGTKEKEGEKEREKCHKHQKLYKSYWQLSWICYLSPCAYTSFLSLSFLSYCYYWKRQLLLYNKYSNSIMLDYSSGNFCYTNLDHSYNVPLLATTNATR